MSSDSKSDIQPKVIVTPFWKTVIQSWVFVGILAFLTWTQYSRDVMWGIFTGETPKSTSRKSADSGQSNQSQSTADSNTLQERVSRLESVRNLSGESDERNSISKSTQAVQKAKAAALFSQAKAATRDLTALKSMQAEWTALEASLLRTDSGKRIVGSPKHLERVLELWGRDRPSVDQIVEWETQLSALTEPISSTDEKATISVVDEHTQLLSSLCQKFAAQRKDFEQQTRLLAAIQTETSALRPADSTLVSAIEAHHQRRDTAEAERITAAGKEARVKAEKEQASRRATIERELVAVQARREEQRIQGEKTRLEKLTEDEKAQIAEEARLQELKSKATIAGLKEEATRVEEGLRWAQLEREMNRDMAEIKGLLMAFTADGFTHRPDGTKGPVSFTKIKSVGGLEPTRQGLDKLFAVATGNNDRPIGGLPPGVGGVISSGTNIAPIERTQALLKKYGELMVRKNMLAP